VIYEINTAVWLDALSRAAGRRITLADIPDAEWDEVTPAGLDAVWLMGVWERSPAGRALATADPRLRESFRAALPSLQPADVLGSPYAVRRYVADPAFGGPVGLAAARSALAARGAALVLDYVPNHVAPDHPWVSRRPDLFVLGSPADMAADPAGWLAVGGHAGPGPAEEFWPEVLGTLRGKHPDTVLIAEAYWDLEWLLQQQGFDFCYDKRLYDRITGGDAPGVRDHLRAGLSYQSRLLRFLENHDEPRIASRLPPAAQRAAAVTVATLPGATMWQEGQFGGRRVRVPVFLARRPSEPPDARLAGWYRSLLASVADRRVRAGRWRLLEAAGWPDNQSCCNLIGWAWDGAPDGDRHLVVVNLSGQPAQGRLPLGLAALSARRWRSPRPARTWPWRPGHGPAG
jgi:hypothetical protein